MMWNPSLKGPGGLLAGQRKRRVGLLHPEVLGHAVPVAHDAVGPTGHRAGVRT